jgi:chromosome condensin MukBEF MukE localization factor
MSYSVVSGSLSISGLSGLKDIQNNYNLFTDPKIIDLINAGSNILLINRSTAYLERDIINANLSILVSNFDLNLYKLPQEFHNNNVFLSIKYPPQSFQLKVLN